MSRSGELIEPRLRIFQARSRFIDSIKNSSHYLRRSPILHFIVSAVSGIAIAEAELKGGKNLDNLKTFTDDLNVHQITIAANHTTHVNHKVLEHTLRIGGYPGIADRLLFAAGLKMWDELFPRVLMPSLNTFPVAAPGYFDEAVLLKTAYAENNPNRKIVEKYEEDIQGLNIVSFKDIHQDWRKGKAIVVVYTETTRSKTGLLQRGRAETEPYFRNGLVLPVMIEGDDEVFPAEQEIKWKKIPDREFKVCVTVGEPVNAIVLRSPRIRDWLKERGANVVDFVTSRIAILNSNRVDPIYRPFYASLRDDIPEGLILKKHK